MNRRFFKSLASARQSVGKSGWRSAEVVFHKAELGNTPAFGARTWLGSNGIHALDAMLYMMGGVPSRLSFAGEHRRRVTTRDLLGADALEPTTRRAPSCATTAPACGAKRMCFTASVRPSPSRTAGLTVTRDNRRPPH
jgi:predicted dehydrogenase